MVSRTVILNMGGDPRHNPPPLGIRIVKAAAPMAEIDYQRTPVDTGQAGKRNLVLNPNFQLTSDSNPRVRILKGNRHV